jgi:hypothetical protein
MTVGFVIFGAAFLVSLAAGTYTHRPFLAASFLTACFAALVVGTATDRLYPAAAAFGLVFLAGAVLDSVRETFSLLVGR